VGPGAWPLVVDAAGTARLFGPDGALRAVLFGGAPVRSVDARSPAVGVLALLEDGRLLATDSSSPSSTRTFAVAPERGEPPPRVESARTRPADLGVAAALADGSVALFGPDGTPRGRRREAVGVGQGPVALLDDDVFARCVENDTPRAPQIPEEAFAGTWKVWKATNGKAGRDLAGHFLPSPPPPWSGSGVRGIVGVDGLVLVDAARSHVLLALDTSRDTRIDRVVAARDGSRLLTVRAVASKNLGEGPDAEPLRLWTPLGNRIGALRLGGDRATAAAFSSDGRVLVLACPPAPTVVCATSPGGLLGELVASKSSRMRTRRRPALTEDGTVLVLEEDDLRLGAYALDGRNRVRWAHPGVPARLTSFDAPSGPGPVVLSTNEGSISFLALDGSTPPGWAEGTWVDRAAWLRGGDRIVVSVVGRRVEYQDERGDRRVRGVGGSVRWRRPDGTLVAERQGRLVDPPGESTPRAELVVVAREDGTFEVDDRDGRPVATLAGKPGFHAVGSEVSADGRRALILFHPTVMGARPVGAVRLFDATDGTLLVETPMLVSTPSRTGALSPTGALHAVARPDGTTVLLDERGRAGPATFSREGRPTLSLAFDAEGARLAIGHEDGSLDVRRTDGTLLLSLEPREGGISGAFAPDGRRLVTWTNRGVASVWTLDVDEALALADARVTRGFTAEERERYGHVLGPPAAAAR
jgi:hypothetical protein